jgi:uncharacterized repeat protein (TIGR03803 family)
MCPLYQIKALLLSFVTGLVLTACLPAHGLTLLHTFGETGTDATNLDGYYSRADLVLSGNLLYGTAPLGGTNGYGTIYSINTDGTGFTELHSFTGASDGTIPNADLVLCGNTLYGMVGRGTNLVGYGSIFSMTTNSENFNILYTFTDSANGSIDEPNGGLIMSDGTLYGTMWQGGISNQGTIFSLNTNGTFTLLHQFIQYTDGQNPLGRLVLANGTLYGTARNYGTNGVFGGTAFSISTNGENFTVLHYFRKSTNFITDPNLDGFTPNAGLILNSNTLYGTTAFGGLYGDGTIFTITTNGSAYSVLHSFNIAAGEGKIPQGEVVMAGDTLYGTTFGNGSGLGGTIFSVNTDGSSFTILETFPLNINGTNSVGAQPYDAPVLSGNVLYGTTSIGGPFGGGTIFSQAIVPLISNVNISGTNLTLNAIEGMENESCTVLTSPNLYMPLNLWTPLATNLLTSGGNFTITVTNALSPGTSQGFYTLQVTPP